MSKVVYSLPNRPTPQDIWLVASALSRIGDKICEDNKADFRFSKLLSFSPVPLNRTVLEHKASEVFVGSEELVQEQGKLVWTFLKKDNVPVQLQVLLDTSGSLNADFDLPVSEFVKRRQIELLLFTDKGTDAK